MFEFDLQLFGGGGKGGSTTTSSYEPTAQEKQIWNYMAQNAGTAQTGINTVLNQYNNAVGSQAFANQLGNAQGLINQGQNLLAQSASGQLNDNYQQNMADSIRTGVNSTVGSAINSLGNRGVLNSSVTNKALNDIESNVSDAMAKSYSNNLQQQAQLGSGLISTANAGYAPYQTLLGLAGNGQSTFLNGAASAMKGTGTTSQTQPGVGLGEMLGSAALGLGTAWAGAQMGIPMFK